MRKLLLFCCFLLLGSKAFSNPIPVAPEISFSELYFEEDGSWKLELGYFFESYDYRDYNSYLCSSTGRVPLKDFLSFEEQGFKVINSTDLPSDFHINPKGDSIAIAIYENDRFYYFAHGAILVFGDHAGAIVPSPQKGESIMNTGLYSWDKERFLYMISPSPTIGEKNNLPFAKIKGKVYDRFNEPSTDRWFSLYLYSEHEIVKGYYDESNIWGAEVAYIENGWPTIKTNDQGEYEEILVLASNFHLDYFYSHKGEFYPWESKHYIEPISETFEEGKIYNIDIHSTTYANSLIAEKEEAQVINFYPNPVKEDMKLAYQIGLPVNTMNIEVEVVSLSGKILSKHKITESEGTIDLSAAEQNTCIVNCVVDGKVQSSTKILISK